MASHTSSSRNHHHRRNSVSTNEPPLGRLPCQSRPSRAAVSSASQLEMSTIQSSRHQMSWRYHSALWQLSIGSRSVSEADVLTKSLSSSEQSRRRPSLRPESMLVTAPSKEINPLENSALSG